MYLFKRLSVILGLLAGHDAKPLGTGLGRDKVSVSYSNDALICNRGVQRTLAGKVNCYFF